ncbi:hypothetical protein ACWD6N_03565 [Micromonospora sp. NPDC005163]
MTTEPAWACGAFQSDPPPEMDPYRCSEPYDHPGDHQAVIVGQVVAQWPRRPQT